MSLINKFTKFKSLALITLATFMTCQTAIADSSVWKVEKDGKHLYLGGTIHVLSKEDYPFPKEFDQAYKKSEVIYFETDIKKMTDPEVANALMSKLMAKEGEKITESLKPETIEALEAFLEKRNIPLAMMDQFNISGVYLVLFSMELANMGMTNAGVDEHYDTKARKDNKTLGKMETIEQQMSFFSKIGLGNEDQLIMYTLRDLEEMPKLMAQMKQTWRSGDRAKYRELMLDPFIKDYPQTYKALLVERNNNWMPKIEALFDTPEIELVLVGALHMIGKDGLLQQLEGKGYTVTPFDNP
jgi:uncharacterized protein YbaP (TraB family)